MNPPDPNPTNQPNQSAQPAFTTEPPKPVQFTSTPQPTPFDPKPASASQPSPQPAPAPQPAPSPSQPNQLTQNPQLAQAPQPLTQQPAQPLQQPQQQQPQQQPQQQLQQQPQQVQPQQLQQQIQQKPQPAKKPTPPKQPANLSTQANLMISELRDGVVIMKDGSFRAVVACKSINFDLMSESEREGVEYSYQNFINSLNFTTQILIRSQRIDIGPYLDQLSEIRRNTDNMLLGVLMDDYINFIDILSQEANIMDKSFFIVIPYYTSADAEKLVQQTRNFFKSFSNKNRGPEVTKIDRTTYENALTEINNRVDAIISGLFQIGIHSVRLNTRELSELYYNFNNPDTAVREPFIDFSKLATTYVKKGEKNDA